MGHRDVPHVAGDIEDEVGFSLDVGIQDPGTAMQGGADVGDRTIDLRSFSGEVIRQLERMAERIPHRFEPASSSVRIVACQAIHVQDRGRDRVS